jgi:hypothetical protein
MAKISNYAPDVNITINDKLLGSSYEGKQGNVPVFKTANFKVADLLQFISNNIDVTVEGINYNIGEIIGDISDNQRAISDLNSGLSTLTDDLLDQVDQLSLLDTTLSSSIQGVADTLTDEVLTLNQKIFDGDTNLSQDLIDLTLTVNQQSTDLTNLISTSIQTATENLTGDIGVVQQAVNNLDTTIGLELGQVNLDIAGALQSAIDAGSLATAAQASINTEIINRANADGAISGRVDKLDTQFEFSTEDGSIIGASGALNQTINTAASTAAGAVASRVDELETEYVIDTESGAITGLSQNSITNLALTTVTGAIALRVNEIETQFAITDGDITGFSEASQTRIDQSISSATQAQFLTLDTVKAQFVFTDGNITNVADVLDTSIENRISTATSAQFQKIDEVATQFVFDTDGNVEGVQGSISSTINTSKQEAISAAGVAAQSKVDTFAAKIVTTNPSGDVTGLSDVVSNSVSSIVASDTSAQFQKIDEVATQFVFNANGDIEGVQGNISSTINTSKQEAISAADIAAQNKLDTFAAKIVTTDSSGNVTGLSDAVSSSVSSVVAQDGYASSGALNTLSSTVGLIPRIYRQNNPPSVAGTPIGSLWFDANNNNKSYVLVAGSPNVWTTVQDQEFTSFKASATQNIGTNATNIGANSTRLTNLNATLDILNANGTIKKTTADFFEDIRADVDANSATATKAENLRIDIEGQDGNGGLTASVNTNQEAVGTINGKLSASYGVHVNAGGKVAGLKLLADSTTTSSFIAQADTFGVDMPNGSRVLTVDSSGLLLNGSGVFTGNISAKSGDFGGWEIGDNVIRGPELLGYELVLNPISGIAVNSSDFQSSRVLSIRKGDRPIRPDSGAYTFTNVDSINFSSWNETVTKSVTSSLAKASYPKTTTGAFSGTEKLGTFQDWVNWPAINNIASTSSNFSGSVEVGLYIQFANDYNFGTSSIIGTEKITSASVSAASTTLNLPAVSNKTINFVNSENSATIYFRFIFERSVKIDRGSVTFSARSTGASSGLDLVFNSVSFQTDLSPGGIYVGMGTTRYFRIDTNSYYGYYGVLKGGLSVTEGISTDTILKGSGSFRIDHPIPEKKDTHHLVHSFVESPQANNIYRGQVTLLNGQSVVNLDEASGMTEGTFVLLNRDIHTFTSNESDWDHVRGTVNGNILTIECQNPESTAKVSWLVIGERHDQHMYDTNWTDENGKVIVEPLKEEDGQNK